MLNYLTLYLLMGVDSAACVPVALCSPATAKAQ